MIKRNALFNISRLVDESVKDIPIEISFIEDFRKCVETINNTDYTPSPYYKPSSLNCIRNMYYQRTSAVCSPHITMEGAGISESGTDRHLRIQYYISRMKEFGIDCEYVDVEEYIKSAGITDLIVLSKEEYETKLYSPKYELRFLCDGIIRYKGEYYILEIKTEISYNWQSRQGVDESHLLQAYSYSLCLNISKVLFMYENRDCCTKKPYMLNVTDENRQYIIDLLSNCESYVKSNIVPPKPSDVSKKACKYCLYKNQCRKDK